jgi:hypothetical protein
MFAEVSLEEDVLEQPPALQVTKGVDQFKEHCYFSGCFRDNYLLKIKITEGDEQCLVVMYDSEVLAFQKPDEDLNVFFFRVVSAYELLQKNKVKDTIDAGIKKGVLVERDELSSMFTSKEYTEAKQLFAIKDSGLVRALPPPPIPKILPTGCASVTEFFERQVTSPLYNPVLSSSRIVSPPIPMFLPPDDDIMELVIPPPPPLPVFFGPQTHDQWSLDQMIERRKEEERLRAEKNARNRKRNGSKIDRRAKVEHKRYNIFVKRFGLKAFPQVLLNVTKKEINCAILESSLSMVFVDVIKDVRDLVLKYFIYLYEASRTNEERTEAESRHEGWTKTTKRVTNMTTIQAVVSETNTIIARNSTIGELPVYMFVLTHKGFEVNFGQASASMALYFAIRRKDVGISARMTFSIPSAFRKVNQIGIFNKVVGYNSEPILARTYPHGLEIEEWTVFRFLPSSVRGDQTHLLLWFTFFSSDGFIACRPFTYAKKALRGVPDMTSSDIATIRQNQVVVQDTVYPLSKIYSWIK